MGSVKAEVRTNAALAANHTFSDDSKEKMFGLNLGCKVVATGKGKNKVQTVHC